MPADRREVAPPSAPSLVPAVLGAADGMTPLDAAVATWLAAKAKRSGSQRTLTAYAETMSRFRLRLQAHGRDLDEPDEQIIAAAAEAFAEERSTRGRGAGKPVTPSTYNQRLAIISSFYEFARRRRLLNRANPLELVERRRDEAYQSAAPLDSRLVAQRLGQIDRETLIGLRDYALLAVGLSTGRRLAELAMLTWGDVEIAGGVVTLTFRKAKGGKVMRDQLSAPVGQALMAWVYRWYGGAISQAPDAPLWIALEPNSRGHQLTHQAISDLCKRRLGTSKVHALRHTFAHGMEAVGASVSEIQARLGHSNLATTGRYLAKLRSAQNLHASELAALFGLR